MAGAAAPLGKLTAAELRRSVLGHRGRHRREVLVPPREGVDVGVVRLPGRKCLVMTTDPLYLDPGLGWRDAAWFAFHILASDLSTCGVPPQIVTLDLNLPPGARASEVRTVMATFSREAEGLGATILTGHTGRYEGCTYPMVGGATFAAVVTTDGYVTSAMARPGDRLLLSKGPALESAVLLARMFPEKVRRELGEEVLRAARRSFLHLSTVPDALLAARAGLRGTGVWAMHDATEGGVRTALEEMARASGLGLDLDLSEAAPAPFVERICRSFGIRDPWSASSEGSLLVAVHPHAVDGVLRRWARAGIPGTEVGKFRGRGEGVREAGKRLPRAAPDGFWAAVQRARRRARARGES